MAKTTKQDPITAVEEKIEGTMAAAIPVTEDNQIGAVVNDIEVADPTEIIVEQEDIVVADNQEVKKEPLEAPEDPRQIDFEEEDVIDPRQIDFEEESENMGDSLESNSGIVHGDNEAVSEYTFSEARLAAYLASDKEQDKIIQISRGGNFVSSKDHTIYVPITLFK